MKKKNYNEKSSLLSTLPPSISKYQNGIFDSFFFLI